MKLFRNESGFALPLALLVMVTTSAILVTAITTTSSSGRTANLGKTAVSAEALAEAGLANGIAILGKPGQDMNDPDLFPHTLATAITYTIDGGAAKLWGVYDTATTSGRLPRRGRFRTRRAAPRSRRPSRGRARSSESRPAQPCRSGAASSTTMRATCFTIDTVTIPGAVASRGPMCLKNGGNVAVNSTGAATTVGVGTNLTVEAPNVTAPRAPHLDRGAVRTGWTNAHYNVSWRRQTPAATYSIACATLQQQPRR